MEEERNRRGTLRDTKVPEAKYMSYKYEMYREGNIVNNYVVSLYGHIS